MVSIVRKESKNGEALAGVTLVRVRSTEVF